MANVEWTDAALVDLCRNWAKLNARLKSLTLETLVRAMRLERAGANRPYILVRLHTRASRLRARAEWQRLNAER